MDVSLRYVIPVLFPVLNLNACTTIPAPIPAHTPSSLAPATSTQSKKSEADNSFPDWTASAIRDQTFVVAAIAGKIKEPGFERKINPFSSPAEYPSRQEVLKFSHALEEKLRSAEKGVKVVPTTGFYETLGAENTKNFLEEFQKTGSLSEKHLKLASTLYPEARYLVTGWVVSDDLSVKKTEKKVSQDSSEATKVASRKMSILFRVWDSKEGKKIWAKTLTVDDQSRSEGAVAVPNLSIGQTDKGGISFSGTTEFDRKPEDIPDPEKPEVGRILDEAFHSFVKAIPSDDAKISSTAP